jgi:hypothetical protein
MGDHVGWRARLPACAALALAGCVGAGAPRLPQDPVNVEPVILPPPPSAELPSDGSSITGGVVMRAPSGNATAGAAPAPPPTEIAGGGSFAFVCQTPQTFCVVETTIMLEPQASCACAGVAGTTVDQLR